MSNSIMNLFYLRQGNKGFIQPILSEKTKLYTFFDLRDILINGEPLLKIGKNYMFECVENNVITDTIADSKLDYPSKVINTDSLRLVELGSINSQGNIVISENFDLTILENTFMEVDYKKLLTKSLTTFRNLKNIPLDNLDVFYLTSDMKVSLTIAYLKELADISDHFTLNMDSTFTKEYSFRAFKLRSFSEIKESLLNNTPVTLDSTVSENIILYTFKESEFTASLFYSKEDLETYIESLIAEIQNKVHTNYKLFKKGGQ